jgi:hypothetical protein
LFGGVDMGKLHGLHAGVLFYVPSFRVFDALEIQQRDGKHFELEFLRDFLLSWQAPDRAASQAASWVLRPIPSIIFPAYMRYSLVQRFLQS